MTKLFLPAGTAGTQELDLEVTPESAGWGYSSLRVLTLPVNGTHTFDTEGDEVLVVPLAGSVTVEVDGAFLELDGRRDVFAGPTDFAYLPIESRVTLSSHRGGRFALTGARTDVRLPFRYGPAAEVPVELRGAGQCSRQVRNFATPQAYAAGKIIACEVITPGGNWSSYPAHKHDEATETEAELEEIYYFEIASGPHGEPGFGYHRTSSSPGKEIDVLEEVQDRDTVLVPHGWHGPCVAAPGFDMYYLNVMAGPATDRAWLISDHPDQGWIRSTWNDLEVDPRLTASTPDPRPQHSRPQHPRRQPRRHQHRPRGRSADMTATGTVRLTVSQAVVKFLSAQFSESDGVEQKLFAGCFGIFGHGNVAGLGQALLQAELSDPEALPYVLGRNEQAMVHSAVAYTRMKDRKQVWAVSTSVGPGATNMITGAALATINRLPVLLLPADTFADRSASPLLQELEVTNTGDVTVNDCFRPVSKYFDRIWRPEQLPSALLAAMRVLTDPVETGAVTLCLPQDVQAEAHDWPAALFAKRVWHIARPLPERSVLEAAVSAIRAAKRPLIVAGGGVQYSGAHDALAVFCEATHIPVGQSQAGKGSLPYDHPQCLGAIGSTGTTAANAIAAEADLVIGIGTRYSDFTTASRTAFAHPEVQFVNVNVAGLDAVKQSGLSVVADARETLEALTAALADHRVEATYSAQVTERKAAWDAAVDATYHPQTPNGGAGGLLTQGEVIGMVNELSDPRDVVVCAAGSMPGDLHKLWRTRDPLGYHVEYGYSCMGYEVAGGLGVAMACPDRDVFVLVGDGSYLMMATELVTAVQEGVKIITVLVQNHGFASIGNLSESLGSQRFGTRYRRRSASGRLDGDVLPVDLAANAASLGVDVIKVQTAAEFADAVTVAKGRTESVVIYVETDPLISAPDSASWWDVPVSAISTLSSTQQAREVYEAHKATQKLHLSPPPAAH